VILKDASVAAKKNMEKNEMKLVLKYIHSIILFFFLYSIFILGVFFFFDIFIPKSNPVTIWELLFEVSLGMFLMFISYYFIVKVRKGINK
jgi:drug/metabolite transporter (DMT)-like permease